MHDFLVEYEDIISTISQIDASQYGKTRNYINGAVSRLSPFVTHGVISTHQITQQLLRREMENKSPDEAYKALKPYVFQLAWRDYFHRLWVYHQDGIFSDLNHSQSSRVSKQMPVSVLNAQTSINVIDQELTTLFETGYIHNHARLWIAAYVCNILGTDWRCAASWMHYHLLDGDLASNTLSWQWVAGTLNSNKKQYFANQENINKFGLSKQKHTVLDTSYEELTTLVNSDLNTCKIRSKVERGDWRKTVNVAILKDVPITPLSELLIEKNTSVFLRNLYNLDQHWHSNEGKHLLLIEPAMLKQHPLSPKRWLFIAHWVKTIKNLEIIIADFSELHSMFNQQGLDTSSITFQAHPLCYHWQGIEESRQWLFAGLAGDYPSFFKFWNAAQKKVKQDGIIDSFSLET